MTIVAALYHFAPVPDPESIRGPLETVCTRNGVKGTLLLAGEGINGTIAGDRAGIDAVIAHVRALPGFDGLTWKEAEAETPPFARMKVRVKREIVTMGRPVDAARPGTHVPPAEWNALISSPDVAVIDTRNDYEVAIGSFDGAIDPGTASFRDFPAWWEANGYRFANKRIAMFCTGGIRCEKSTAFLREQGVEDVYHLQGGILKYLEEIPEAESLWNGGCFVFDERVSVGHGLKATGHTLCRACRRPLTDADRADPVYEEGVQCPRCVDEYGPEDRARFRERQRQVDLAAARGARHIGAGQDG
ncbi:rhodanese-related sulfurtransferase [Rhodobacterales bacterium HKCCE2091]|nr:rhodanese-related sulfurtransferase [Rhodobacterales bacterium HKCCE2091]